MTQILPPGVTAGAAGELLYSFSQRNLLTSNRVGSGWRCHHIVATYGYDGGGNRIQQVDHSGDTPITTTYTNDIMGLPQVLVANDGSQPVYSLLGLDLISQDDGTGIRTLLVDGLGSVRQEMAGGAVETTSTYDPYGTLLVQTGTAVRFLVIRASNMTALQTLYSYGHVIMTMVLKFLYRVTRIPVL